MSARAQEAFRPLTNDEMRLLHRLIGLGSQDLRSFEPQLEGLMARRSCTCGCASIQLQVAERAPRGTDRGERVVGDFAGETIAGNGVGILLFQDEGKLTELEVYPIDGLDEAESGLPVLETLSVLEWEPSPHNPDVRIPKSPK